MSTGTASWARAPGIGWWLLLATVMTIGYATNWAIAAAVLVLVVAQLARPFDFLTAFLVLVGGATFVQNTAGRLTFELSLLTCAIPPMLLCYTLASHGRALSIPRTPMTWPVLWFLALSLANTARGILAGYSPRYVGLELLPLLALGTALLVANAFDRVRHLLWALVGLVVVGVVAATRGVMIFAASRTHGEGYTMAAPGLVGILLVNLALRSKSTRSALGLILLAVPMFLQQFLTFGRGLWSGCVAALVASLVMYTGFGRGSGPRWKRAGVVLGGLLGVCIVGAFIVSQAFERENLLRTAGTRLQSTLGTEVSYETRTNLIRVGEYLYVWKLIQESPWVGHGVGYAFTMKQAFSLEVGEQWYAHQYFLFVWLKQGLIGLGLFTWMLVSAIALGAREARRRPDSLEATWFSASAGATVFLAVLSLSNYPFGVVNEMFLLALLWGGAMAMARAGGVGFRWSAPAPATSGGELLLPR